MEYKFTEVTAAPVAVSMTISEIGDLRAVLEHVLSKEVEIAAVSRWRIRRFITCLNEVQGKAADTLRYEADVLAKAAKRSDD